MIIIQLFGSSENTYPDVQPAGTTVNEVVCLKTDVTIYNK